MGEYGRVVGETSGTVGGSGGRSTDLGGDVMRVFSDLFDQVAALPTELVIVAVAVVFIGGIVLTLRPS
jgi:hypothetical protein